MHGCPINFSFVLAKPKQRYSEEPVFSSLWDLCITGVISASHQSGEYWNQTWWKCKPTCTIPVRTVSVFYAFFDQIRFDQTAQKTETIHNLDLHVHAYQLSAIFDLNRRYHSSYRSFAHDVTSAILIDFSVAKKCWQTAVYHVCFGKGLEFNWKSNKMVSRCQVIGNDPHRLCHI